MCPSRFLSLLSASFFLALSLGATSRTELFNANWKFALGEHPDAYAETFDASEWEAVRLPHDWAISGPFDEAAHGSTGKLPWKGEGWYRKTFTLPAEDSDKKLYFDFDGVMAFPKIYINGILAGEWDYGYTGFRIDASDHVRWGETNLIAVHADTGNWNSRWYPGAGIYRKVTMTVAEPVHFTKWGIGITTNGDELTGEKPDRADVTVSVDNHRKGDVTVKLDIRVLDPAGNEVATILSELSVPQGETVESTEVVEVPDPLLWDIEHPHLYTAVTTLSQDGEVLDREETSFGFRTFAFTADDGFHLNGRRVQMNGVNLHHDLGPLGAAFNTRAAERQLEIMQEMGVNTIRTSHNPSAPEVIELCDRMGILVWDEVFDKWGATAGRPDLEPPLNEFGERHVRATVLRDRNSPSVVVWSTGNELTGDPADDGINPERVQMMADFVRQYDPSRPVAMGCHIPDLVDGENFASLDLAGWNYDRRYARYREIWPDKPIVYSESASTVSTRGYYEPDLPERPTDRSPSLQVSSYDLNAADWSDIPDVEFALMEQDNYVAGELVWTGFDYLGEPTPFDADARSSYFGIVDLVGFPKDRFFLYRSHWRPDATTVHILPHWNWPDRVGEVVPVFVYTNGDAAELFLNGRSLGLRKKGAVPERAENLALNKKATIGSGTPEEDASAANDGDLDTLWTASRELPNPSWQVDLGKRQAIRYLAVTTATEEKLYAYEIAASNNGQDWQQIASKETSRIPQWGGPREVFHTVDVEARHLRITFTGSREDPEIGLREFAAYRERVENPYYDVTYDYRLRWNDVAYEPGTLRAVAYKNGKVIGESSIETTGIPEKLRLSADRTALAADGDDLAFITVEALDAKGLVSPLADNLVRFTVDGPGEIAGVGNGNPLSFEPFQADQRALFYGKAMLIVRTTPDQAGEIRIRAMSEGLDETEIVLTSSTR